jgi:hypothetical protein
MLRNLLPVFPVEFEVFFMLAGYVMVMVDGEAIDLAAAKENGRTAFTPDAYTHCQNCC